VSDPLNCIRQLKNPHPDLRIQAYIASPISRGIFESSPLLPQEVRCYKDPTAFLEKGEPFRESSPQHSVSTKGFVPCASQPVGPSSLRTALEAFSAKVKKLNRPGRLERRLGRDGKGDYAALPRLLVAATRDGLQAQAG
jgi:hypothetical protein